MWPHFLKQHKHKCVLSHTEGSTHLTSWEVFTWICSYFVALERGCQTRIHSGPKLKSLTKSRASLDIYWKNVYNFSQTNNYNSNNVFVVNRYSASHLYKKLLFSPFGLDIFGKSGPMRLVAWGRWWMSTEEGALVGPDWRVNAPAEHSGICGIRGACAVFWRSSSSRHLVLFRGPRYN